MSVQAGAQAPEVFRVRVENPEASSEPLDLSTVTAAELHVTKPGDTEETWPTVVIEQSATVLVIEHEFVATDVEHPGAYSYWVRMTVPSGIRRAGRSVLRVIQ